MKLRASLVSEILDFRDFILYLYLDLYLYFLLNFSFLFPPIPGKMGNDHTVTCHFLSQIYY